MGQRLLWIFGLAIFAGPKENLNFAKTVSFWDFLIWGLGRDESQIFGGKMENRIVDWV